MTHHPDMPPEELQLRKDNFYRRNPSLVECQECGRPYKPIHGDHTYICPRCWNELEKGKR